MDSYLRNDMSGLNGLLEKHKQMQERSAIKSQVLHQNVTNVVNPVNPVMQTANGLYPGNPAMVPYANSYYMGSPMLQCANGYYNPNPMLQPASGFFDTNPMLQPPNNYFNPNPMLQAAAAAANYFNPNPMMQSPANYFNFNAAQQFPVPTPMPTPMPQNSYFDQNLVPMTYDANFPPTAVSQYQNAAFIQNPVTSCINSNYAFMSPYLNGNYNQNPMSQCPTDSYGQNLMQQSVNTSFNVLPATQNVNSNFAQTLADSYKRNGYRDLSQRVSSQNSSPVVSSGKVYVNPNYKKSLARTDPKTTSSVSTPIQENVPINAGQDSPTVSSQTNAQGKHLVHVNPKLMTKLISTAKEVGSSAAPVTTVSCAISSSSSQITTDTDQVQSSIDLDTLKPNEEKDATAESGTNAENDEISKKNANSSIVILTRRKLVRVKKSPRTITPCINFMKPVVASRRRLLSAGSKKLKISPKKMSSSANQLYNANKLKYVSSPSAKILSHSVGIVNIDGVLYSKSRNQLVRSNSSVVKRKRDSTSDKSIDYYVAEDGKKLLKLDIVKMKSEASQAKLMASVSPTKSYKSNVSNKVKRKSLQILRDKMRKNNQPCLLFQKFGYCTNQLKGTCPKVHDKKLVAVCRKFLQGKCLLNNCPLSHDVGPEKMPTCKYFLEGNCTREGCPYLHVKVSSKKPICTEFLRGYCPLGNECPNRHIIACPEFDRSGSCSKGKFCPYPHKSPLTETKRPNKRAIATSPRRKSEASSSRVLRRNNKPQTEKELPAVVTVVESKKRYYDEETSEDLSHKRDKLLKQIDIAKSVHAAATSSETPSISLASNEEPGDDGNGNVAKQNESDAKDDEVPQESELICSRPRRPPIGPLPAYIPIE